MSKTGRSYDYYDMFNDNDDESEKNPQPKPNNSKSDDKNPANKETETQNTQNGSGLEFVIGNGSSKEKSKSIDKDSKMKLESKGSQENNTVFDPAKYMKVYNKGSGENKRNSSTSTEFKDYKQELEDKVRSNITFEGTELIYKMELIEGNFEKEQIKTKAPIDDGKPMFYIDPTPIAVYSKKNNEELYIPAEKREKDSEKRYFVVGQERFFKTQEKSLVEKLNKFLKKPGDKANGDHEVEVKTPEEEIIIDADMNTSGNRYFSYNIGEVCRRCKRTGHFERMCPEEYKVKCNYCMGEHNTDQCTQMICFMCYKSGHRAKDCTVPKAAGCYRCGKRGHKREDCGMLMLRETHRDKKETGKLTKCLKCHKFGHISCDFVNISKRGDWYDDLFEKQQAVPISIDAPKKKISPLEHVYYRDSSDDGKGRYGKHQKEEDDLSDDLNETHLKSFLKSYSKEELHLMSSDESEKELRRLRKQERFMNKTEKLKKKEKKITKYEKSEERKRSKSQNSDQPKNGYRKQSKFVEKKIQQIKRDRKRSSSHSQPKIKKVKSY